MRLRALLLCSAFPALIHAADSDSADDQSKPAVTGAFMRGDSMTWDQLQVVAKEVGISGDHLLELRLKDRALRIIQHYRLPLEVADFSAAMPKDEEFKLVPGTQPGVTGIQFNSDFWAKHEQTHDNEAFVTYLLFRAEAFAQYRNRYDPEHCTWIVREEAEPLHSSFLVLRTALNDSAAVEDASPPPTERDLEFRRTLEPTGDPVRTLHKLIDFALRCIAQKAADNTAIEKYHEKVGDPTPLVVDRVRARERSLASDFGRARFAMAIPERVTFHRILKTPFRYVSLPHPNPLPSAITPSADARQ